MKITFGKLTALGFLLIGCAEWDSEVPDVPVETPPATVSTLDARPRVSTFVTAARFEGYADPANGIFEIAVVPNSQRQGQYSTTESALYCAGVVESDGDPNTNPVNTFQLDTIEDTVFSTADGCRGVEPTGNPAVGAGLGYESLGVFCANVRAWNFATVPRHGVYAEIEIFTGLETQVGMSEFLGGSAERFSPDGYQSPSVEYGLWDYNDLAAEGDPWDSRTIQWVFKRGSNNAFSFEGRIIFEVQEDCFNGIDDDCDDEVDNYCGDWLDGEACFDDADCASGSCDMGLCATTCGANTYGTGCLQCPFTGNGTCNGVGTCDDGASGTGACDCPDGTHGTSCEFSCSDQALNGDESAIDCGGSCGSRPEVCNGRDDDCDGSIDELVCTGDTMLSFEDHAYHIITETDTWANQRAACQAFGYDLATIDSLAESIWLRDQLGARGWIGLTDSSSEGTFVWASSAAVPLYENWNSGEPNDWGGGEDCTELRTAGNWNDMSCTSMFQAVCESPSIMANGADSDSDGIPNPTDLCPDDAHNDIDLDGVCAGSDNCPDIYNPDQTDGDSDGFGDECDLCPSQNKHTCENDDGICPCNCDIFNDNDCTELCGDYVTNGNEACDGDCPTSLSDCNDSDACTIDYLIQPDNIDELDDDRICSSRCENPVVDGCTP